MVQGCCSLLGREINGRHQCLFLLFAGRHAAHITGRRSNGNASVSSSWQAAASWSAKEKLNALPKNGQEGTNGRAGSSPPVLHTCSPHSLSPPAKAQPHRHGMHSSTSFCKAGRYSSLPSLGGALQQPPPPPSKMNEHQPHCRGSQRREYTEERLDREREGEREAGSQAVQQSHVLPRTLLQPMLHRIMQNPPPQSVSKNKEATVKQVQKCSMYTSLHVLYMVEMHLFIWKGI